MGLGFTFNDGHSVRIVRAGVQVQDGVPEDLGQGVCCGKGVDDLACR